jgi:beta-ribofuranosylaminobenzene 5'-phosphate synthase
MAKCVTVAVGARLHLGFLDLNGGLGRRFGSLGLALDAPETILELSHVPADSAAGPQAERAADYVRRLAQHLGLPGGHRIVIREAIPAHHGLGSGTQLALAGAAALRRLHGLALDVETDALVLDRAARSGLGTGLFMHGGLALDGGRGADDRPAPIIARLAVPEDWHILLILDPKAEGVHGADEVAAFKSLPVFPAELAGHLCRLALMQALPAVAEGDLSAFGRSVTEIQKHVGDYFAAMQGGRFASPGVAAVLDAFAANGIEGYGQSSWGPTGFAFAESRAEARRLRAIAAPIAAAKGVDLQIVKGRNSGASIGEVAQAIKRGARHG